MRRWFEVLRDREDGAGGGSGSDTHRVDMGAPQEVGVDHEPSDDGTPGGAPKKSADAIKAEQLEADLAEERKKRREAEEDADYWARRGRRAAADVDEEPQPRRAAAAAPVVETPREMTAEELVEGLNKEGVQALYKAGFLTQKQVDEKLDALRTEMTGFVRGERSDAEFNGRIAQEFPTIARESAKANAALKAGRRFESDDPLFVRTGEIYREMIADDAALEKSPGTILAAARAATRELQAEGKGGTNGNGRERGTPSGERPRNTDGQFTSRREETPARRRDRIERQRPDRGADDDETRGTGADSFTEEQQAVMKHLNVKPEKFVAHRDAAVRQESRRGRR